MTALISALVSIALSVAAQFCLKAGMMRVKASGVSNGQSAVEHWLLIATNGYVLLGLLLYGLGAVIWLRVLSEWDVSKAYPLVGLGFVATAVVGFALGEHVGAWRVFGIALISAGIIVVGRS